MRQSPSAWIGRTWLCAALGLLFLAGLSLQAEELDPPEPEADGALLNLAEPTPLPARIPPAPSQADLQTPSKLFGNLTGARDALAENGFTFLGDITQYYQGVTAGGLAREFEYGGRADYLLDFDSRKLGLWEGGHFDLRGESRFGEDCNQNDGSAALANFAMALPLPNRNITALTGVQYTQDLSDKVSVYFGKLNLLDGTPASYARGMRLNYFWNVAMQSNLSRSYLFPSTLGAGFTVRDEAEPVFHFYLLNTRYTPTTDGISTLFNNGMLAYGEYRQRTNWMDLPGHYGVGFLYSTATRTTLDVNPYELLKATLSGTAVPTRDSAWSLTYRFDQVLYAHSQDPRRNWAFNGDFGLTDGNPNPIKWFANASLVGYSPFRGRENDTIGLGYYHLGVSDVPILTVRGFGDENGVELFYNAAVSARFHITPDLQVLDPAQSQNPTTLLVGIRARLSL